MSNETHHYYGDGDHVRMHGGTHNIGIDKRRAASDVNSAKFLELASYLTQVSSTLDLHEARLVELQRAVQQLHDEAVSQTPQPGRLRELAGWIKGQLQQATSTAVTRVGVQMVEQAIGTPPP
jgi:hypothetical protein